MMKWLLYTRCVANLGELQRVYHNPTCDGLWASAVESSRSPFFYFYFILIYTAKSVFTTPLFIYKQLDLYIRYILSNPMV